MYESDAFFCKKVTNYLFASRKSYNFAPDFKIKRIENEKSEPT